MYNFNQYFTQIVIIHAVLVMNQKEICLIIINISKLKGVQVSKFSLGFYN